MLLDSSRKAISKIQGRELMGATDGGRTTEPRAMMSLSKEISSPESVVMLFFPMSAFVTLVPVLKSIPAHRDKSQMFMIYSLH